MAKEARPVVLVEACPNSLACQEESPIVVALVSLVRMSTLHWAGKEGDLGVTEAGELMLVIVDIP